MSPWRQLGGLQTLASYYIQPRDGDVSEDLRRRLLALLPRTHELFLQCLRDSFACGDFLFVHAGIRPGVSIEQQNANDLDLDSARVPGVGRNHGKFIVHGHSPVPHPDIRHNRINIDTGAWKTGTLTCAAIEGSSNSDFVAARDM